MRTIAGPPGPGVLEPLPRHIAWALDPRALEVEHAAVGVQKPREADDFLALGAILDQMQRLGHGHVHLTARDERHGVEVFLWFDELELDAFFFKPSLLLSHEEWDVIGVEEPLQTECDFVRHEDVPFSRSR